LLLKRAIQQALGANLPVSGHYSQLRGRAAQAQRSALQCERYEAVPK